MQLSEVASGAVDFAIRACTLAQKSSANMHEVSESNERDIVELQREWRGIREYNDATQRMHSELLLRP